MLSGSFQKEGDESMSSMVFKRKSPLLLFLLPAFAFLLVFLYYPFVMNVFNSFNNIRGLASTSLGINEPWYANYQSLFTDPKMATAFWNTMIMIVCTIIFQVGIALVLALLVDNIKRGTQFFRTVYFFPIVISASALGVLFNLVFLFQSGGNGGGMLNQIVSALGLAPLNWKEDSHAFTTMMIPVMWQYVGFYFVILITGLTNISSDIYEAAEIDGAGGFKRVRYITLPLLHNVLCTCLTLAITGALKVFDLPWVMFPKGMPMDTTWLTGTYMYYQAFQVGDVDYSSTIAVAIVVLGVLISQVVNRILKEKDY